IVFFVLGSFFAFLADFSLFFSYKNNDFTLFVSFVNIYFYENTYKDMFLFRIVLVCSRIRYNRKVK
ncbi:TPA: hypothetical protein ACIKQZ_003040, partial [Enterococcus faecalis]